MHVPNFCRYQYKSNMPVSDMSSTQMAKLPGCKKSSDDHYCLADFQCRP